MTYYKKHVFICTNQKALGKQCCALTGGESFFNHMKTRLVALGLHGPGRVRISKTGCLGRCGMGPCIVIYPDDIWYRYTSIEDIDEIIEGHLIKGVRVTRLALSAN